MRARAVAAARAIVDDELVLGFRVEMVARSTLVVDALRRGSAEDLARAALSAYVSAGEAFADKAEEIRTWLSARSLGV